MPLSGRKLKRIVKNAGQAAADAKACGLDGVYLHGHEGYLLEQMTNPAFNRRAMGPYADYQRFGIDIVKEIRKRAGDRYPIMYRIDLSLALNETYGEKMNLPALKKFKNGRTVEQTLDYMVNLIKAGVDIFDVDLGCYDNWWLPHPPAGMPAGCFLQVSKLVKDYFKAKGIVSNAGVPVPVVAVGKLGYPDVAEKALRDEMCDMIMLGRPLLADPEWPNKAYAGRVEDIRPCIGCQEGCINEFVDGGHPQCAVNPRTGFEDIFPEAAEKAAAAKKVAVIGAGPAGITLAIEASKRGHQVDLYEKGSCVGGKIIPGSVPKCKFDIDNYRMYMEAKLQETVNQGKINLILNTEVDAKLIKSKNYDTAVTAIGTKAAKLNIPGAEKIKTVQAEELLLNPELIGSASKIVIIGGGVVGCETAYYLSYEKKCDVTVIEMLPYFMDGSCTANRGHLIYYMEKNGVRLINMAKVVAFEERKVKISRNVNKNVPDPYNTWSPILPKNIENPLAPKIKDEYKDEILEADLVVFAAGGRPDDRLFYSLQEKHAAPELYNIGDSFSGGRVLEATRAGYRLAMKL
jgi:2-enoate reductase